MITGFRLSHLADGEPLLGRAWEYKDKTGIDAAVKRLEDEFFNASYIGFTYVIDTIIPMVNGDGDFTLENNGLHGDIWTLDKRLKEYQRLCYACHFNMVLEFQFPVEVTASNVNKYADFIMSVIVKYNWIKFWQIGVRPDKKYITGNYNCSPRFYVELMRNIYPKVKAYDNSILLGGPGVLDCFDTYVNPEHSTPHISWLNDAMGDNYTEEDEELEIIGMKGFTQYIDFFAYQGKYQSASLSYNKIDSLIQTLKSSIYTHIGKYLPMFTTWQGRQGDANDSESSRQQAYYDMRELLKSLKVGTTPFICELTDYYPDSSAYLGKFDPNRLNYGLFTWYMSQKQVYNIILFVMQALSEYDIVYKDSTHVYEKNENVDCITFRRTADNVVYKATIIWSKTYAAETVVLLPASYQREYQILNGQKTTITNETQINLSGPTFVIVYERIEEISVDTDFITYCVEKKLQFQKDSVNQMMSELPSSYNREITDTNVYRLLRTLAVEMANAKLEMELIKKDLYLDFAREEAIYENFGALIKLKKKNTWSYEKYRRLVKGVTKSLLSGATLQSVTDALQLFTNFKVSIFEMYNHTEKYIDYIQAGVFPKWSFIIELEKPIDDPTSQSDLESDAFTVLRIVKPAHTLGLLIISLVGEEDWKSQYYDKNKVLWETMDESGFEMEFESLSIEQKFGWRAPNYTGNFQPGVYSNQPLLNNGVLLGPRYVLFDIAEFDVDLIKGDKYIVPNKVQEEIEYLLQIEKVDIYDTPDESYSSHIGYTEEPFGAEQTIDLFKLGNPLNQYLLGNNHRSRLKDILNLDYSQLFEEEFHLAQNVKVIRFSTNYGFNAKFINNNDMVVEIGELLTEHNFRKKIHHYEPDKSIMDRFKLNESTLNNYRLYPYPEDGYDYEEERLKDYLYGSETGFKEDETNNDINFIQKDIEEVLELTTHNEDIVPELGSNYFTLNDKYKGVLNQGKLSPGIPEKFSLESEVFENISIPTKIEDYLKNEFITDFDEDIFEQCDKKLGEDIFLDLQFNWGMNYNPDYNLDFYIDISKENFNYFKDIYETEHEFKEYYLPFFTLNRSTLNDFILSPRILVLESFQIESVQFSEIYPAIVENTSMNLNIATYEESMYPNKKIVIPYEDTDIYLGLLFSYGIDYDYDLDLDFYFANKIINVDTEYDNTYIILKLALAYDMKYNLEYNLDFYLTNYIIKETFLHENTNISLNLAKSFGIDYNLNYDLDFFFFDKISEESNKIIQLPQADERNNVPIEVLPLDEVTIEVDTNTTTENVKELLNPRYAFKLGIPEQENTRFRTLNSEPSEERISFLNRFCSKLNSSKLGTTVSLDDSPVKFMDEGRVEDYPKDNMKDTPEFQPETIRERYRPFFFKFNKTLFNDISIIKDDFNIDENSFTDKTKLIDETFNVSSITENTDILVHREIENAYLGLTLSYGMDIDLNYDLDFYIDVLAERKNTDILLDLSLSYGMNYNLNYDLDFYIKDDTKRTYLALESVFNDIILNPFIETDTRKKLYYTKGIISHEIGIKDKYPFEIEEKGNITNVEINDMEDFSISKDAENPSSLIILNQSLLNSSAIFPSDRGQRIKDVIESDRSFEGAHKVVSNIPYAFKFNTTPFNKHPFLSANTTDYHTIFESEVTDRISLPKDKFIPTFETNLQEYIGTYQNTDIFLDFQFNWGMDYDPNYNLDFYIDISEDGKEHARTLATDIVTYESDENMKDNYQFEITEKVLSKNIEVNRKERYKLKSAVAYCELTKIIKGTTIVIRKGTFV